MDGSGNSSEQFLGTEGTLATKKSQGLVDSNTKKRKNTEKLHPPLCMERIAVKEKKEMEILGLTIDANRGNWSRHIQAIASDARKRLGAIRRMSHMLDDEHHEGLQSFCTPKD